MCRSLHGNIRVVVANIGGLSNMGLAVREGPDVALLQELWASAEDIRAEAKRHGYVAAVADGPECLAAVLFRPGTGQQLQLPPRGAFSQDRCSGDQPGRWMRLLLCLGLKELLSQAMRETVEEFRSLGG